jgi:hypothetical protein
MTTSSVHQHVAPTTLNHRATKVPRCALGSVFNVQITKVQDPHILYLFVTERGKSQKDKSCRCINIMYVTDASYHQRVVFVYWKINQRQMEILENGESRDNP